MKKMFLLAAVLAIAIGLIASPAVADQGKSNGAVKEPLVVYLGPPPPGGQVTDLTAGWVIACANGNDRINIQVHVDLPPDHAGVVAQVLVKHPGGIQLLGYIELNVQGNGNFHFNGGDLSGFPDPMPIMVRVVTPGIPVPHFAQASLDVPLK